MRIHGIMVVKDEADILGEALAAAIAWCDRIYVLDNGSTDGTWEIAQRAAELHPQVVPFKQDPKTFSRAIRGDVFRHYRSEASRGDWWCVLDGDEFYIDDPRTFLARVPPRYGEVWSSSYQYYLTDEDALRFEADPDGFTATPTRERLRYYLNNWSEARFYRHGRMLRWPESRNGTEFTRPLGRGTVYPHRIRLRHYQYRSPAQIDARLRSRLAITTSYQHERDPDWLANIVGAEAAARFLGERGAPSESRPKDGPSPTSVLGPTWRDRLVPASALDRDELDGSYVRRDWTLPALPRDRLGLHRTKQVAESTWWRLREVTART